MLGLPHWYETTDDGRKIHRDWQKTLKAANLDLPSLGRKAQGQLGMTDDPVRNLSRRLDAVKKLIRWSKKLGDHTSMLVWSPSFFDHRINFLTASRRLLRFRTGSSVIPSWP